MKKNKNCYRALLAAAVFASSHMPAHAEPITADTLPSDPEFDEILSLGLPDLVVTSVAKRQQKLTDAPAAIYVITQEEIRRAGATNIPDALRMVPGVQVARVASNRWAISARGFNSSLANKLLVMIDGRSIYTPVFSGVYWDDQSTLIQDIDRIEVIRGPGASLWGANAVNGIINIITKSAQDTQGNLISVTSNLKNFGRSGLVEARHGGKLSNDSYYRTYATYLDAGSSKNLAGRSNPDEWNRARTGFRVDSKRQNGDKVTFQGDIFGGHQEAQLTMTTLAAPFSETVVSNNDSFGGNLLGRWDHQINKDSELSLQAYVDHYTRKEANAAQRVSTADIQMQNSVQLNERNHFIWGTGARLYVEQLDGTFSAAFNDEFSQHHILSAFVQDEYTMVPETLFLTLGSKLEHNDFTGFEIQPSARLSWHPVENQTVWAAVSRAVRTPSSVENDLQLIGLVSAGAPPNALTLVGNPQQESEELIAYELGHRIQLAPNLSFDTALFYNDYDKLQTIGPMGAGFLAPDGSATIFPFPLNNAASGKVHGAEFSANWHVTPDWRLTGSYSLLQMDLDSHVGSSSLESGEAAAPRHQFSVRSYFNLSDTVHWDNMLYYVDNLSPPIGSYLRYDSRIAWLATPGLELSLIARNLLDPSHPEFPGSPQAETARSFVGQASWKF